MRNTLDTDRNIYDRDFVYVAEVDVFSSLYSMFIYVFKNKRGFIVEAGEELGGPKKETLLDKKKINSVDTGLVICPNCLALYSFESLMEWFKRDYTVFKQTTCTQCGKIKLIDILNTSGMIDGTL